jgi:hypothetical protein
MKSGIKFLIAVVIFTFIISTTYGQKSESGAQNITSIVNTARYILFGGTYILTGGGGDNRESAVFKLDTYTGKTWVLKVEKSVNGRVARWIPVNESGSISVENRDEQKRDNGQKTPTKTLKTLDE